MTIGSPTVRRRRLGNRLKRARQALGMTGSQVAGWLEISQSKVSRVEGGEVPIKLKELREFLDLYQVPDLERTELLELARDTRVKGWWTRYASVLTRGYASYIGFESEASEIRAWEPTLIPGFWQTEAYYRAMLQGSGGKVVPTEHTDAMVEVRAERQRQLAKTQPRTHVVLAESVLHWVVGDKTVMAEQWRRLIDAASEPDVTIQVLPFERGADAVGFGGITILGFDDGLQVVWGETPANETSKIEDERPDVCIVIFDHLRSAALDPDASLVMLERALDRSAT